MNLSVAIITYNEEHIIERILNSVSDICDEIIVLDSFSTDDTENICRNYNKVKFFQKKIEGFGKQKNNALELCSGKWILFLDADEVIDEDAKQSITQIILQEKPEYKVYSIFFNNIFLGKKIKYGGWGNISRERFYMKNVGRYSDDLVHENFITDEKIGVLKGKINHYTYRNIFHHLEKVNKYTTLMAKKKNENGKKFNLISLFFKPFYQFIKTYIFRLGFLDGLVGFYCSIINSFYTFLKYIKLYELQQKK